MSIAHKLVTHEGFSSLTVIMPSGDLEVVDNSHPRFSEIVEGVQAGDEAVFKYFDVETGVSEAFNKVSERVSLRNGNVYLDNELVDGSLTDQIVRFYETKSDFTPLVKFLENVANNPNEHSRVQLYDWLRNRDFTITDEGDFIGYKGVRKTTDDNGEDKYTSISHGDAIVDGVPHTGAIPNYVGAVVEMPRSQVTFDPQVGCNTGLHAGTWSYAHGFAQGATLTVSINPRDVVSVPVDSDAQKLRVCRYKVIELVEQPYSTPYYSGSDDAIDYEEDEDYDYDDETDEDLEDDGEGEDWDMDGYDDDESDESPLEESPDTAGDEDVEPPVSDEQDSQDTVEINREELFNESDGSTDESAEQSKSSNLDSASTEQTPQVTDVNSINRNVSSVTNFGSWGSH